MAEIKLKIASVVIGSGEGGGSGVAPYYADLPDKPSINGETLAGNMTSEDLGLASAGQKVPAGGTTGQVLAKKSNADNDVQWVNQESGGQGTTNYADLDNKPQINSVVLSGNKSASDLGLATASQGAKADTAVQQVTVGTTTTGTAGSNASVTNSGTTTNPILDFTIPRGADGQDAVNPFKGYFNSLSELQAKYLTGETGDFANVYDSTADKTYRYVWDASISTPAWVQALDSSSQPIEVTPSTATFATGEELINVGIDNEPTAGSNNLVRSGGAYGWASNVILGLTSFDLTQQGYYNSAGVFVPNTSYRSEKFDIPNGALWVSTWNYRQSSTEGIIFFDSNDNVVYHKSFENKYVNIKIEPSYTKVAISSVVSFTSPMLRCFFSLTPLLTGMEMVSFNSGEAVSSINLADSVIINSRDICQGGAIHNSIQSSVINETQVDAFTYTQNAYNTRPSVSLTSGKRYRIYIAVTGSPLNFQFTGVNFYNDSGLVYTDPTITSAAQLSSCVVDFTPEVNITKLGVTFNSAWVGSLNVSVTVNEVSNKFTTPAKVSESIWENTHDVLIVHDIVFSQTTLNSGYKEMELRAGIEYSVKVISSGEYSGEWQRIIFYSATSASSSVYVSFAQEFTFTPSSNINYCINLYTSGFSGEADVEIIVERVVDHYLKTEDTAKVQQEYDAQIQGLSLNVFGDVLPADFKEKFLYGTDDLLIVCQGDSLTGLTQNCLPALNPSHSCPGGQYQSWVSLLQKQVSKVKPFYNRLDSIRDDVEFFTKIGTWEQATTDTFSPTGDPAIPDSGKESSVTALTFRSSSDSASVSFAFDADNYDKCNIVFTKNIEAGSMGITIQEGNGKMLASIDRTTWVEANGFTHSQATLIPTSTNGEATCERHRRIWMKKVSGVEGTIHIAYAKTGNDGSYVYFWGTEMYNGRAILFDNIGRGGRYITLLARNISDIFDRNPDLTLLEMPITNDLYHNNTDDEIKHTYDIYFAGNDGRSYKQRSNNFENFPIIVVLPHTRSSFFDDDDNAIIGTTSEQTIRTAPAYCICKTIYGYLWNLLKEYPNVSFINLYDKILNEAKYRFGGWKIGLSAGNLTADGTHPNQNGANVYAKYISAIFQ